MFHLFHQFKLLTCNNRNKNNPRITIQEKNLNMKIQVKSPMKNIIWRRLSMKSPDKVSNWNLKIYIKYWNKLRKWGSKRLNLNSFSLISITKAKKKNKIKKNKSKPVKSYLDHRSCIFDRSLL